MCPWLYTRAQDLDQSDRQRLKLGQTLFLTKGRITASKNLGKSSKSQIYAQSRFVVRFPPPISRWHSNRPLRTCKRLFIRVI
jgi:hypothetical protein